MKLSGKMKHDALAREAELRFAELVEAVPFLKLSSIEHEVKATGAFVADSIYTAEVAGEPFSLVVEFKQKAEPSIVRHSVLQLKEILRRLPGEKKYGILMAPFISERSAAICDEEGIGRFDLAGNSRIVFDNVFIATTSRENPFKSKRELKSVFSPKAGRVLRKLLEAPLRHWRIVELKEASGVSIGQVSNVRKQLINNEWAAVDECGLRIVRPAELLRAWRNSYQQATDSIHRFYTLLHGEALEESIRSAMSEADAGNHLVLASFSAAKWIAPFVRQATTFMYADSMGQEIARRHLKLSAAGTGANVVLLDPAEDDVFTDRLELASGLWGTGYVQTYLDLAAAGERGIEAAEHLLERALTPAWMANEGQKDNG